MKKRLFVFILVLCLAAGVLPMNAFAQPTLVWPVPGHTNRSNGFHGGNAIDISDGSIYGATVVAAMGGTVTHIWLSDCHHTSEADAKPCCWGFGTGLVIAGDDGRIYQYAHMIPGSIPSNVYRTGYVSAGQQIGRVGNSGWSTGTHLHFGISLGQYWYQSGINPDNETYIYSGSPTVSMSWGYDDCRPEQTNAFLYIRATADVSGSFTEAGITVWDGSGNVVGTKSEGTGISGKVLEIWYNLTNEIGIVLKPGTDYKYQFYAVFNGKRYESPVRGFRTTGVSYVKGDSNDDGKVDLVDLRSVLRFVCGKTTLSEKGRLALDINADGKVDLFDLRRILRFICKKTNTL